MLGRPAVALLFHLAFITASAAQDAAAPIPAPMKQDARPVIQHELLVFLARDAVTALNQANRTGNYTVLRALGTAEFQQDAPEERLSASFADFRTRRIDLASVLVLEPVFSQDPAVEGGDTLHLAGVFPTKPLAVAFDLRFRRTPLGWRIAGMAVTAQPDGRAISAAPAVSHASAAPKPTQQTTPKPRKLAAKPIAKRPAAKPPAQPQSLAADGSAVPRATIDY